MSEWDIIDDEVLDGEVKSTLETLRSTSQGVLEKVLQDRTYQPSLEEAKVVISHLALESATEGNRNTSLNSCKSVVEFINAEVDISLVKDSVPKDATLYFRDIAEDNSQDSKAATLYREIKNTGFYERLDLETSDKLALFMAEHLADYEPAVVQEWSESGAYSWVYSLLHDVHMSAEAQDTIAELSLAYADSVIKDPEKYETGNAYEYYVDEFVHWGKRRLRSPVDLDPNEKNYKTEIALYVKQNGLPRVLNMIRADMSISEKEDKAHELLLFIMGDLRSKVGEKAIVDENIEKFYEATFVEPGEYILNRETKQKRIDMIISTFEKYGLNRDSEISEFASGAGWLSGALESEGYKVHAFDQNQALLDIALSDYPNVEFQKFNWNRWQDWNEIVDRLGEGSQNAIVINGRSERHLEYPFESMSQISKLLQDGGIYMSDSPDVELKGSPQAQKLENNRQFHEQLGFYRPWLDKYFWHMVGAPPGQHGQYDHYIESWTPSAELKILYAEANGLEHLETIVEENYDGQGSNNLYMVFKRIKREDEQEFKEKALKKIDDYFANQPQRHMFDNDSATYRN